MIGADDGFSGIAAPFKQFGAPVAADIVKAAQLPCAVFQNDQGMRPGLYGAKIAGFGEIHGDARKGPAFAEHMLLLGRKPAL